MKNNSPLHYVLQDRRFVITLSRPERHNALSSALVSALAQAFEEAINEPRAKVILLKAEGSSFCAGADLSDLQQAANQTFEEHLTQSQALCAMFRRIYCCPKPVVAQVQGAALGGGCGLVAVCDLVLASENAHFGCPEAGIGFVAAIIMQFLLRRIGEGHTKSLTLSAQPIKASKAQAIGLVNSTHPSDQLETATQALLSHLIEKNSQQSMQLTKGLLYRLQELPFEEGLSYASEVNASTRSSEDFKLGIRHFLNKEPLRWSER